MNCWKSVNVKEELGIHRLIILSILVGIISFIMMFVPFSIAFQNVMIKEPSFIAVILSFVVLFFMHKLGHIIPILFTNKELSIKTTLIYRVLPMIKINVKSSLAKKSCIFIMLAPTLFITVPLLLATIIFPMYYPIILLLAAFHISLSLKDWLTLYHLVKAPKRSIIEMMESHFDILVNSR